MSKKIIFFILLFNLTGYAGIASSEIVPLKKPIQTKEETQKKLLIDVFRVDEFGNIITAGKISEKAEIEI